MLTILSEQDIHQAAYGFIKGVGINDPGMTFLAVDFDVPIPKDGFH